MQHLRIHEVGLRDGLQMEKETVPAEMKLRWLRSLIGAGLDIVQVGSFVHPGKVPQMADTDALFRAVASEAGVREGVTLSALVLNEKGLERGLACGVGMFCMGVSASETHSRKNTGMGVAEATDLILSLARKAEDAGTSVQLSVQSAFGCGYEGPVPPERVLAIVRRYLDSGFRNISLADTAGHADPAHVESLYAGVRTLDERVELACHFHNTYGLGLANVCAALRAGVTSFESSVGGMGGCPFTRVAGGNVATEDMVHMFRAMGLEVNADLGKIVEVARAVAGHFKREMPGTIYRTGTIMNGAD